MMERMSTVYCAERRLTFEAPVDLARSVSVLRRGSHDPTISVQTSPHRTRVFLTARVPEHEGHGIAAVLDQSATSGLLAGAPIDVVAWGQDRDEVDVFLASAGRLVGLEDDWSVFASSPEFGLLPHHARAAYRLHPGLRLCSTGWIFKQTVTAIFEQRVTGSEAIGAWQRMVRRIGSDPAPAPHGVPHPPEGMVAFPTPQEWLSVPSWEWRRAGVDAHRARAVRSLAERAPSLLRFAESAGPGDVARQLSAVPGIGAWTIAEAMQRSHGLPDAISVGDYHLAHGVCYALEGRRGDDTRMLELLRPWAGNRQRVVRLLGLSTVKEPRRGPRVAPRSLAG